jgi:hypothetical protein
VVHQGEEKHPVSHLLVGTQHVHLRYAPAKPIGTGATRRTSARGDKV